MSSARTKPTVEEKIRLVRDLYAAFGRGDIASIQAAFADDVGWHFPGSTALAADVKGKAAAIGRLGLPMQYFEEFKLEVHDVLGSADHVVALVSSTVRRNGRTFQNKEAHVFHVSPDLKVAEAWFTLDTEQMKEALES
jgi:uncharacterized protein